MKNFPAGLKFKYPWRKYQERVLLELENHLDDNHLHIIAPPGSGKTILGLEVALRLNKPTLIFAPTIAIRNQWIQRFCELFLQVETIPNWISRSIKEPGFLTVVTYQSLHAACSGIEYIEELDPEDEIEAGEAKTVRQRVDKTHEVIRLLKQHNIGTIVVDEAHHLKNQWWKSLTAVKNSLQPTIVGLTATPPYDVSYSEWQRYLELNGPVDAEISIPELVVEGDLCPHQDLVFFSRPTYEESQKINAYRERISKLFQELRTSQVLKSALENHPFFSDPLGNLEKIYLNIENYSAILIYLNDAGVEISKDHIKVIGDNKFKVPSLNFEWMEILLSFYLYSNEESFLSNEEHQEQILNKLIRNGAIERKAINFRENRRINTLLSSSISKLKSIQDIVEFEYSVLGKDLRMVILTDYIRKEFLVNTSKNDLVLNKIGVVTIFEQIRRSENIEFKLGVLSGSVIILPLPALEFLSEQARRKGILNISASKLKYDENYYLINITHKIKNELVHLVTKTFREGHVQVLVGTKSLLGEGWDAPSINSLILASFVGSYVLSNQMRGRAIRTERQNPQKTGNIWHMVCVDPTAAEGGEDMELLKRRFKAFVGISFKEEGGIENGIGRLNLVSIPVLEKDIDKVNVSMLDHARKRDKLAEVWRKALLSGNTLIEEIKVPFPLDEDYEKVKELYYNRTIKYLMGMLGSGLGGYFMNVLQGLDDAVRFIDSWQGLVRYIVIIAAVGIVVFGRLAYKTFRLYIKYRDISKDTKQIGEALVGSLIKAGVFTTEESDIQVISTVDSRGAVLCHLQGGTTYEKSIFIDSMQEIIGIVDNPRYLIIRKSLMMKIFSKLDYHSVPEVLGRNKKTAEYFRHLWKQIVGNCELVYTRSLAGRRVLLRSRIQSLAAQFQEKSERINKWR